MTTWDIAPSGGDYTSSNAAASNASTVASDILEVSGDWTSTTDTAKTTLADDNLIWRGKVGDQARHAGFDNGTTNYELAVTSGHASQVDNTGCTIDGLLITGDNTGSSNEGCRSGLTGGGSLTIINTIFRAVNETSQQDGIFIQSGSQTVNMENVMCYGWGRGGITCQPFEAVTTTANIISATVWDCHTSGTGNGNIQDDSTSASATVNFNIHNTISVSPQSGECYEDSGIGTATWNIDNCIASDTSIASRDSGAVNENASITVVEGNPTSGQLGFVDITSDPADLRLFDDAADNVAMSQHSNGTGAGLTIGDYAGAFDIAGTARSAPYDIGAHRRTAAAAGGLSIPVAMRSYRNMRVPV